MGNRSQGLDGGSAPFDWRPSRRTAQIPNPASYGGGGKGGVKGVAGTVTGWSGRNPPVSARPSGIPFSESRGSPNRHGRRAGSSHPEKCTGMSLTEGPTPGFGPPMLETVTRPETEPWAGIHWLMSPLSALTPGNRSVAGGGCVCEDKVIESPSYGDTSTTSPLPPPPPQASRPGTP